jgi:hypothetical protein
VRASAAHAIEQFFEGGTTVQEFQPFLEHIAAGLLKAFHDGPLSVQEVIMKTLSRRMVKA